MNGTTYERAMKLAIVTALRAAAEEIAALDKQNYREHRRFWTAADAVGQLMIIADRMENKL